MNDEHDVEPYSPLDPEQDARVRALLADLGTAPDAATMPTEVADRLEETLAGLAAERRESAAVVVPLRRRWAPRAAAVAAAVVVVGAGGVAAANLGVFGGSTSQGGSTADSATSGDAGGRSLDGASSATAAPSQ